MNADFAFTQTTPHHLISASSPLQLADRLISLAVDADRAGHSEIAGDLLRIMYSVLDRPH